MISECWVLGIRCGTFAGFVKDRKVYKLNAISAQFISFEALKNSKFQLLSICSKLALCLALLLIIAN
jgi:hypothetical protein